MSRIVPKLNLNRTPQSVDNMSLVFAKNIKLRKDNTLGRDNVITSITPIPNLVEEVGWQPAQETVVGYIPFNNQIYFFHSPKEVLILNNFTFTTNRQLVIAGSIARNPVNTQTINVPITVSITNDTIVANVNANIIFNNGTFNINATFTGSYNNETGEFSIYSIEGTCVDEIGTSGTLSNLDSHSELNGTLQYLLTKVSTVFTEGNCSFECTANIGSDDIRIYLQVSEGFENEYLFSLSDAILCYDELTKEYSVINSAWHYSGGIIDGYAKTNLRNDILLVVAESDADVDVPIKTINIGKSSKNDDESIYTQAPIVPLKNFVLKGFWETTIPNGVYQFFIRYKINNDTYTDWFPVSKEIFVGTRKTKITVQGYVKNIYLEEDSSSAPCFRIDTITNYAVPYSEFQVGFILSTKDSVVARSWKTFGINTTSIYFDYDKKYIEEIKINDILKGVYNIYNVKNITNFKNKTYISNYKETDFNKSIDTTQSINLGYNYFSTPILIKYLYPNYEIDVDNMSDDNNHSFLYLNRFYKGSSYITPLTMLRDSGSPKILEGQDDTDYSNFRYNTTGNFLQIESSLKRGSKQDIAWYDSNGTEHQGIIPSTAYYDLDTAKEVIKILAERDNVAIKDEINTCKVYTSFDLYLYDNLHGHQYAISNPQHLTQKLDSNNQPIPVALQKYSGSNYLNCNRWDDTLAGYCLAQLYGENGANSDMFKEPGDTQFTRFRRLGFIVEPGSNIGYFAALCLYGQSSTETYYERYTVSTMIANFSCYYYTFAESGLGDNKVIIIKRELGNLSNQNVLKVGDAVTSKYIKLTNNISTSTSTNELQAQTLLQGCFYNFYIHFVTKYGEISNGYKINSSPEYIEFSEEDICVPNFNATNFLNKNKSAGIGYFYSIEQVGRKLLPIFNLAKDALSGGSNLLTGQCLEISTLVSPIYDNIEILRVIITTDINLNTTTITTETYFGTYYDSGMLYSTPSISFGNSGVIVINGTEAVTVGNNEKWYVVINNDSSDSVNPKLIKCSPYYNINNGNTNQEDDFNLLGYVIDCKYPTNKYYDGYTQIRRYISGTNAYTIDDTSGITSDISIKLEKIKGIVNNNTADTNNNKVFVSGYNFNFVNLTNDITSQIRTYEESHTEGEEIVTENKQQLLYALQSLLLADVYSLDAMYRDYTRKLFTVASSNPIEFTNTIRSSELVGDESEQYVVKFAPEDYYNVPTDKGKITNLKAIGDIILVHTQDSLYKFTGKAKLTTSEDNVQVEESEPFDTGIQELFGSDFGFAGLASKFHSFASQFGYIWWDKDCGVIYLYAGEGQLAPISDPIHKLLKSLNITNIKFGGDFYNDRFFICIEYRNDNSVTNNYITLSYNVKAKSFVSLHDFYFKECINTKAHTYFITNPIGNSTYSGRFGQILVVTDNEGSYDVNYVENKDDKYPTFIYSDNNQIKTGSVVDVIFNENYETIKTINAIHWICNEINSFFTNNSSPVGEMDDRMAAEENLNTRYAGNHLMIYTDTCKTKYHLINDRANDYLLRKQVTEVQGQPTQFNDIKIDDVNISYPYIYIDSNGASRVSQSYEKPRWNLGKWSFNYFRNILNNGGNTEYQIDSSLVYGKYIVVRFIFDDNVNFKLENLDINYGTTK